MYGRKGDVTGVVCVKKRRWKREEHVQEEDDVFQDCCVHRDEGGKDVSGVSTVSVFF